MNQLQPTPPAWLLSFEGIFRSKPNIVGETCETGINLRDRLTYPQTISKSVKAKKLPAKRGRVVTSVVLVREHVQPIFWFGHLPDDFIRTLEKEPNPTDLT